MCVGGTLSTSFVYLACMRHAAQSVTAHLAKLPCVANSDDAWHTPTHH